MLKRRVVRVGNSIGVLIPCNVAELMALKAGDEIEMAYDGKRTLTIRGTDKRRRFVTKVIREAPRVP